MKRVIAVGLYPVKGEVRVVELLAERRSYWIRVAGGEERPLPRDAAKVVLDYIGDPDREHRSDLP